MLATLSKKGRPGALFFAVRFAEIIQGVPVNNVKRAVIILAACFSIAQTATAADDLATQIDLPYERFQLDNGLTVLVHTRSLDTNRVRRHVVRRRLQR